MKTTAVKCIIDDDIFLIVAKEAAELDISISEAIHRVVTRHAVESSQHAGAFSPPQRAAEAPTALTPTPTEGPEIYADISKTQPVTSYTPPMETPSQELKVLAETEDPMSLAPFERVLFARMLLDNNRSDWETGVGPNDASYQLYTRLMEGTTPEMWESAGIYLDGLSGKPVYL